MSTTPIKNMCDDAKSDARLNVLYSPFRRRELNPQDWESKMTYWKNMIINWCLSNNSIVFSVVNLQGAFIRNGRPASCLATVVEEMSRCGEIVRIEDLLRKDLSTQSWSSWAVNYLVKAPVIWSFEKLKESLIQKSDLSDEKFVHLNVLKKHADKLKSHLGKPILRLEEMKTSLGLVDDENVQVLIHWLQLEGQATVRSVGGETVVKLSTDKNRVTVISDTDVGLLRLQQNEQALTRMLAQLEDEKQGADQEARSYLRKGMRQAAKSCLRKKKELEKCIDKRASALENVHVLLSRVKEAETDGEILEAYKMGLAAIKATFKDAGLSEDGVCNTMDQVKEVLEVHEEIQSALSEPMAASLDQDLEEELANLLASPAQNTISSLPDMPEPPSESPKPVATTKRVAESHLQ